MKLYNVELFEQEPDGYPLEVSMSSLSDADVEIIKQIGHVTVKNIVSLVVETVLWSECFR